MSRIVCQSLALLTWDISIMLPFERTFHKGLKTEKSFEISLSNQKI